MAAQVTSIRPVGGTRVIVVEDDPAVAELAALYLKNAGFVEREETFIRAFPDPGGPPLETDLFAGVQR